MILTKEHIESHLKTLAYEGSPIGCLREYIDALTQTISELTARLDAVDRLLNTPEIEDFDKAVPLEAAHQVLRWTTDHDAGKNPEDWFWLIGYLAGKALAAAKSGDTMKAKHHCISTSAALRNWHAQIRSGSSAMRPGIAEPSILDAPTKPKEARNVET